VLGFRVRDEIRTRSDGRVRVCIDRHRVLLGHLFGRGEEVDVIGEGAKESVELLTAILVGNLGDDRAFDKNPGALVKVSSEDGLLFLGHVGLHLVPLRVFLRATTSLEDVIRGDGDPQSEIAAGKRLEDDVRS
jgi:hypothetical protein